MPMNAFFLVLAFATSDDLHAFYSEGDRFVVVLPAGVHQDHFEYVEHVTVAIRDGAQCPVEEGLTWCEALAWESVGWPDCNRIDTVYQAPSGEKGHVPLVECVRAITAWFAGRPTADAVLASALGEYGIASDFSSNDGALTVYVPGPVSYERASIATLRVTNGASGRIPASGASGWAVHAHDNRGQWAGVLRGAPGPRFVDCAADSAAAAEAIAEFISAPVSRHCDCYASDGHGRKHDHECNLYTGLRPATAAAL
ncbi:hypothetical protein ABT024_05230 [Streptomyces sp. NPDC002812]|uniref:hypothetical protein n=1 Tax=Streptomyces sp. NPDC002812 TaxID=3154434 RepID=UPI00331AA1F4